METQEFLDAAVYIAERIARQAEWTGTTCTWRVRAPQASLGPRGATLQTAGGGIYQGTAGIAWFLGETASRATSGGMLRRAALGGIEHALAAARNTPPGDFGFHTGRPGIAWVAVRLAETFDISDLRQKAWEILEPLAGHEHQDQGLDIIAGAAGAIPALLGLARVLGRPELIEVATRLGEHLISRAHLEPIGWSWDTIGPSAARHVCGFAHGASGFGLAFLELYRATSDSRFRFAAEMAFLYERQFFDTAEGNWPDLRNIAMGEFTFYGKTDELRRLALAGQAPRYRRHSMFAWCHGAPGIGLARLRAWELTGQELYLQEARAALSSTVVTIEQEAPNQGSYSLCHGIGGNCELPLLAAARLDEPRWLVPCARAAELGWNTFEKNARPWPCGTATGESDPSLLVGEAGIGAFFLRLASPDLPSLLLLRPDLPERRAPPAAQGFSELAGDSVRGFFGNSVEVFQRLHPELELPLPQPGEGPIEHSPVAEAYRALGDFSLRSDDPRLADALCADAERFEMTLALEDFNLELLRHLTRPAWEDLDLDLDSFQLPPASRLVSTRTDWAAWLAAEDPEALPAPNETHFLLFVSGHRVHSQKVGAFTAIMLYRAMEPASLDQLVDRVADSLDESLERSKLEAMITRQLEQLYRAGLLDRQA